MKIFSFPPISDSNSKILILGTMPGKDSLKFNQYYGHSRNAFWKIMFTLFNEPFSENYECKKQLLLKNGVALWDVLKVCEREGSLDSAIIKEEPNDLSHFLKNNPNINHLFFNGNKSKEYFTKYVKGVELSNCVLPSTSPAHTLSFSKKTEVWSVIKKYI
jgi:TDG/mug DNA glycosylase family protein